MKPAHWRIQPLALRSRLALLILAALAPAFGLVVYSHYEQQQSSRIVVRNNAIALANGVAAKHAQIVERARELLLTLSVLPAVRALDAKQCSALFAELLPHYPQYLNLVAANAEGDIFCSARPMSQPVSVKTEPSFTRALENRGLALGEFAISKITGRPFIGEGYPVFGARGEAIGVVGAILSVDWLNREAAKTVLPPGHTLSVLDATGTVVVRAPDAEKWVGKQVSDTPIFQARLRGEPYIEGIGVDGVAHIFGLAKVDNVPPPSVFYVSVGSSVDQAYRQVRETLWRNILLLLAIAVAVIGIAWYGTGVFVAREIDQLVATSKKVVAGDRGARAADRGGAAEIRALGRNFNAMLDALDISERRYRDTLDNVHLIAVALDERGNVTYCNDFLVELSGWRREEVLGRNWFDFALPDPAPTRSMFEQAMRDGNIPPHYDNEILTRAGERRLIHWYNAIVCDAAARIVGTVSLGEDITERARLEERNRAQFEELTRSEADGKRLLALAEASRGALLGVLEDQRRAEFALVESNEKLRLFDKYAPSAIAMFDRDMRYVAFSRRWLVDYDLGEKELVGRSHYEVFPDLPERWKEIHRRCLAGAIEKSDEDPFARADGSVDWVRWEVHPWQAGDGAIGGVIIFSEVITARKQAEDALRESRARLEALTRQLLEVQESERRSIARELHDEVGGVLTAVKLNLQSLRRKRSDEAALTDGIALVDGAIEAVRSISLDLRPAVLDDLGLIPALRWYCEHQALRAGIPIELALDAIDLKTAPQLESACYRIVQESITNALRHAGARRIEVALRREDGHFMIEIADDGAGFAPTAARSRESSGLLGMEERVKLLGGRLAIDSAPGAGTRVRADFVISERGFG